MHQEPFVKLRPVFKDYLWGGEKLKALYGAKEARVAEAWLLSAHPDGESVIAEGEHRGMPFSAYLQQAGWQARFPLLIKFIDSAQKLSVQVHPGDEYARIHENDSGKNEMWLILESKPGAYLYVGFSRDVDKAEIRQRIADGTIEEVLNKVPTHPGDRIYIPAGTVHAIGEGNLILEIQQSSNATYRLYDYNRRGQDGKLRPLHIDKALDVLNNKAQDSAALAKPFPFFTVEQLTVSGAAGLPMTDAQFAAVICIQGDGNIARQGQTATLRRGDSLYLPPDGAPAAFTGDMQLAVVRAAYPAG